MSNIDPYVERLERALGDIAAQADLIAERFGDAWEHSPACLGEPGCPLCRITYAAQNMQSWPDAADDDDLGADHE